MKIKLFALIGIVLIMSACKDDEETTEPITTVEETKDTSKVEELIRITTSDGRMLLWLYPETPKHRNNMFKLAKEHFYDSTEFHRVVADFVIQGGDPNTKDDDPSNDGRGGPGYTIDQEINASKFKHIYGAVGAARNNNPAKASNGSQFYIVVDENGEHGLDGNYTVFGFVIDGMPVAETIEAKPVNANDAPLTRYPMQVDVVEYTRNQLKDSFNFVP